MEINELEYYPEIEQYILMNNFTGHETRITISQLQEIFGEIEASKILTNRSDYWTLTKV